MAITEIASYDTYLKNALKSGEEQMNKTITDSNAIYAKQGETIKNLYSGKIADSDKEYNELERENEIQEWINRREVAENNANLGLTDSGLNRTQQTAVRLSAANNAAEIARQRQSMADSLTREMNSYLADIEVNRATKEMSIRDSYYQTAAETATNLRNADIDARNKELERLAEAESKYTYRYDNSGNVVAKFTEDDRAKAYSDLTTAFEGGYVKTSDEKAKLIYDFIQNYDASEAETAMLLGKAQIDTADLERFSNKTNVSEDGKITYGTTKVSPQDYNTAYKAGKVTAGMYVNPEDWDYNTNGNLRYNFEIVENTPNGLWGIDHNDVVNIYYPDGTLLKKNVKISQLPDTDDIKQKVTNRVHSNDKDRGGTGTFYMSCDLKGSKF